MQKYRVGQILFLIADASKVVPIQVIEEVIRTTLEGKEKTYIVKFPDKKGTTADIKKVKGQLFSTRDEVKTYMFDNAKNAINQMVMFAEEMSVNIFESHPNELQMQESEIVYTELNEGVNEDIDEEVQQQEDDGIIRVDLGNGKYGKINVDNLNKAGAPQ